MLAAIVDPATGEEETVLLFMHRRRTSPRCCSTLLVRGKWRGWGGKAKEGSVGLSAILATVQPLHASWLGGEGVRPWAMGPLTGVEYYRVKDIAWNVSCLSCNYLIRRGTS